MDKKERLRAGLQFGIGMTVFFIIQNLWVSDRNTAGDILSSVLTGVVSGAVSGILLAWVIGLFVNSKFVARGTNIKLEDGEEMLLETGANHFKGLEGVGGKLYLTNKRLVFKSHKLNIQRYQLSIELPRINCVRRYKSAGVLNNGISVTTDTTTEKFVVQKPEQWTTQLEGIITTTNTATA